MFLETDLRPESNSLSHLINSQIILFPDVHTWAECLLSHCPSQGHCSPICTSSPNKCCGLLTLVFSASLFGIPTGLILGWFEAISCRSSPVTTFGMTPATSLLDRTIKVVYRIPKKWDGEKRNKLERSWDSGKGVCGTLFPTCWILGCTGSCSKSSNRFE